MVASPSEASTPASWGRRRRPAGRFGGRGRGPRRPHRCGGAGRRCRRLDMLAVTGRGRGELGLEHGVGAGGQRRAGGDADPAKPSSTTAAHGRPGRLVPSTVKRDSVVFDGGEAVLAADRVAVDGGATKAWHVDRGEIVSVARIRPAQADPAAAPPGGGRGRCAAGSRASASSARARKPRMRTSSLVDAALRATCPCGS